MRDHEREQLVIEIVQQLHRLANNAKRCLNWDQRLFIAEELRSAADATDWGIMERSHRTMVPTLKRLRLVGRDALGRQLYRMK